MLEVIGIYWWLNVNNEWVKMQKSDIAFMLYTVIGRPCISTSDSLQAYELNDVALLQK